MASRTHRDMAIAVSMAEIFSDQMTGYYQAEKPKVKRIRPLLDDLKKVSREAVSFFSKGLDEKDVFVKIVKKVDGFNNAIENRMDAKQAVVFIIGLVSERICELSQKNIRNEKIGKLEPVLRSLEAIYEYFSEVDRSQGAEEKGTGYFMAWEAA